MILTPYWIRKNLVLISLLTLSYAHASNNAHVQYQSPLANATLVSEKTTIIVRPAESVDPSSIQTHLLFEVKGSRSGSHEGRVILSDDGRTVIFQPKQPLAAGENVFVILHPGLRTQQGASVTPLSFHFTVAPKMNSILPVTNSLAFLAPEDNGPTLYDSFDKTPSSLDNQVRLNSILPLDFPYVKVLADDNPAPGRIFVSDASFNSSHPTTPYLLILDDSGFPIFYRRMFSPIFDFKVQPNGNLTYFDSGVNTHYELDSSTYAVVDSFRCGNGYLTDLHEFRMLPNGHALLLSYDPEQKDMSTVVAGGMKSATVIGLIIQEIDVSKNVVWQWRSWDHFQITDATHEKLTASVIDYVHGNAVDIDPDGNLLLSSRHMDEITKIDRQTGDVIWRLGGKNNQFTFVNDSIKFSHQHAIRRLSNGDITLFDNGNFHSPPFSRAAEYRLDEQNKTASLVWEFRHHPPVFGPFMGYVQLLPNGDRLIGWGGTNPTVTEVHPDGSVAYELTFDNGVLSYRAYRFPWRMDVTPDVQLPTTFTLYQNYPNPFNSSTVIRIGLNQEAIIDLTVFDQLGRPVAILSQNRSQAAGEYEASFNGSTLASGAYYYRFTAGNSSQIKKMMLLK